jgi:ElaA protein
MFGAMDPAPAPTSPFPHIALRWQWSRLLELSVSELYAVLAARQQVFTVEQHCAFQDADGYDFGAWHLIGWTAADSSISSDTALGASVATSSSTSRAASLLTYLRVLDPGVKYAEPSIGRVLTVPPYRRTGIGRTVMQEGIARCRAAWPGRAIRIAAQQRLEAFYASLAFRPVSPVYIEDDIPHIDMLLAPLC